MPGEVSDRPVLGSVYTNLGQSSCSFDEGQGIRSQWRWRLEARHYRSVGFRCGDSQSDYDAVRLKIAQLPLL